MIRDRRHARRRLPTLGDSPVPRTPSVPGATPRATLLTVPAARVPVTLPVTLALTLVVACGPPNEFVPPPPPEVSVAPPVKQTFTEYDHFTGRTSAAAAIEIRARVEGFLLERFFEEGDLVEAGTLLFQIDPAEYAATLSQAEAAISSSKARFKLADATVQRLEQALESNAVSVLEVLQAQAEMDAAQAAIEASEAQRDRAALDLAWTRVTAPMDGRVGEARVDPGNLVGSGENTLLTTLVQYDPMYVDFDVSERQLVRTLEHRAADGQATIQDFASIPLEVGLANTEDYPFSGLVNYVGQGVDTGTGTLQLRGALPNPPPVRLVPGLFVRIRVPKAERDALMVPERALGTDQQGRYVLVVGTDGVVAQKPVVIGPQNGELRVIEQGLEAGDRIIVNGLLRARPGAKVTAVPTPAN